MMGNKKNCTESEGKISISSLKQKVICQKTKSRDSGLIIMEKVTVRKNMKVLICLAFANLCLVSVYAAETCETLTDDAETSCEYPKKLTLISSPNRKQVDANNCNSEFEKSEWQEEPSIIYADADPEKTYTLLNVDPDPPGYQKGQYYLHWLVSNIKGEDFAKGDLSKANHHQGYYGPAPPAGSGVHRYMFLAFEEGKENRDLECPSRRSKFELVPWLKRQEGLCGPVAGIQFRTKF